MVDIFELYLVLGDSCHRTTNIKFLVLVRIIVETLFFFLIQASAEVFKPLWLPPFETVHCITEIGISADVD